MTKFEFCSIEWVEAAREYLLAHAEGADLTDLNATFNEVFTDAPDHLNPDAGGRIGWSHLDGGVARRDGDPTR